MVLMVAVVMYLNKWTSKEQYHSNTLCVLLQLLLLLQMIIVITLNKIIRCQYYDHIILLDINDTGVYTVLCKSLGIM